MPGTSFPPSAILRNDSAALADLMNDLALATPTTEPVASEITWRDAGDLVVSDGILPAFSDHPDDATVDQGDTLTLTWSATNASSFQVQKQEGGTGSWADLSGATSSPWTSGVLTYAADNGDKYRVVATGPGGTATSNPATLTVNSPITVALIYDDEFTIDRSAPLPSNTDFAASGAGNTKVYNRSTAAISGGVILRNSDTGLLVMDAATERARSAGRIHYVKFTTASTGSFQEFSIQLNSEYSGSLWWATNQGKPRINIKSGLTNFGDIRADDNDGTYQGHVLKSGVTISQTYELVLMERSTGSAAFIRTTGGDWRILWMEKVTTAAGKLCIKHGAAAIPSVDRICTANTSFGLVPLVQHSFASVTGPSDGAGQPETGGSGVAATTSGSVTISGSVLQMSADGSGSVVFETGVADVTLSADFVVYDGSPCGLIVRYSDASNYLMIRINSTNDTIELVEVVAGSETVLASADATSDGYTMPTGSSETIQCHCYGTSVRAYYYSGALHHSYVEYTTSRFQTATKVGVFVSKGSGATSAKASNFVAFNQIQAIPAMTNT